MFAGVEVLNECNHGTKGQNGENLYIPEVQVRRSFDTCTFRFLTFELFSDVLS